MTNYDKKNKDLFTSVMSFAEAKVKAIANDYVPISQKRNKKGIYMIFARKRKV